MEINLKLSKDFERFLDELKKKFGEDFEYLNGVHPSQLDFSEFIDNFVDKDTVADATIDPNANVNQKDIRCFMTEKGKGEDKLFALNKIFSEIKKMWGLRTAKQWLEQEFSRGFYLNDSATSSYFPYCFRGDTEIMTKDGIKPLAELEGKPIKVLNKNHGWEPAEVKKFGKQELVKLTLQRNGNHKEIFTTSNHRWFVREKSSTVELTTAELKTGMRIPFNTAKTWSDVGISPFGVAHGFFIGDGDKGQQMRVNFCGDKDALIPYFSPSKISGSEKERATYGVPKAFARLPDLSESPSYLYGWLAGYFAADGCIDVHGRCTISSTNPENLRFVQDVLCVLGMPINPIKFQDRESNLTGEMGRVYYMAISRHYLRDDFFIRPTHIEKWNATKYNDTREKNWIVANVEPTGIVEDVYCAVTESGSFTLSNNVLTHNCWANDFTRLATEGLFFLNKYNNEPPKHLTTYFDDVIEFVSFLGNRQSGAVGMPNVLIWAWYFWQKDIEGGYYMKNPDYYLRQQFQKFIYRLNQPFLRIDQTAFTNVSIFDRPYLEALFGGIEFPDGTFAIDHIEDLIECQKVFMEVVSEIRETNMFTFPVLTYSLLYKDGEFKDEPFARWCSAHNIRWSDSNFFVSDDVGVLSNCPLAGDTDILYKSDARNEYVISNIKNLYKNQERRKTPYTVISDGKEVHCRVNQFPEKADYLIELCNGDKLQTTGGHLNKVYGKDYVSTKDLTTEDYLPYGLHAYPGLDQMTYEEGFIVGMFLGDGSYANDHDVTFSLNREKKAELIDFIYKYIPSRFAATISECPLTSSLSGKPSCVNISARSHYLRGMIEMFVDGHTAITKSLKGKAFLQSIDFRKGIIDGLYKTDGGNSNRIYTSSYPLVKSLKALFATLGMVCTTSEDNREGRLGSNTNYTVRFYTPNGRTARDNVYIIDDDYMWIKIKSITRVPATGSSYCLEVLDSDAEPVFTLANGIITHNCRLLSQTSKLDAFINSIGGTALSVGSCRVSTINLVRIAYESGLNKAKYLKILKDRVLLDCKALTSMRHIIQRNIEKGLLPNYQDGAVELDKQFCTIGGM